MIYAIRAVGTEFIKFGKTKSVGKRLTELEVACPHDLHIEAVANWPDEEERRLHIYLRDHLVRGEWFRECERTWQVIVLLRNERFGLQSWQTICEEARINKARTVNLLNATPSQERKLKAIAKYERRRLERKQWWADKLRASTDRSEAATSEPATGT